MSITTFLYRSEDAGPRVSLLYEFTLTDGSMFNRRVHEPRDPDYELKGPNTVPVSLTGVPHQVYGRGNPDKDPWLPGCLRVREWYS